MEEKDRKRILRIAEKRPTIMRTPDFIRARLVRPDLSSVLLEMGPSCNLNCFHCGVTCGPNETGVADPETVYNVFNQAKDAYIRSVSLTDGEPMWEENRESVGIAAQFSSTTPACIMTNGVFGETPESAEDWISFLKQNEMDFQGRSNLTVSFGQPYAVSPQNYVNINQAIAKIFPEVNPGEFLYYKIINMCNGIDTVKRINGVIRGLRSAFGTRRSEYLSDRLERVAVKVYPEQGKPIDIDLEWIVPIGRAYNLPLFDEVAPERELQPHDLYIGIDAGSCLSVSNSGDVDFGDGFAKFGRETSYGNVNDQPLSEIANSIREDKVFWVYKLGGVPFVYHLAQQVEPGFSVVGRSRFNVAREILGNADKRNSIREYLEAEKVGPAWGRYIKTKDLRVKATC